MIQFNELRIDNEPAIDGDYHLIIDVSLLDPTIEGSETLEISNVFVGFGSTTEVEDYLDPETQHTGTITRQDIVDGKLKGIRFYIPLTNDQNKQLVYVKVDMDDALNLLDCNTPTDIEGYVYDKCLLMNNVFTYLKESNKDCEEITNLANYIAKIKGLELAIEGGNFELANKYWNKFFINNSTGVSSSNCGCR